MTILSGTKVRPLNDGVLVRPRGNEEKTRGGVFLPDTSKEKPVEGVVVATGPGRFLRNGKREPMQVQPDQVVLYAKYAGTEVTLEGVDHILLREPDIFVVISE